MTGYYFSWDPETDRISPTGELTYDITRRRVGELSFEGFWLSTVFLGMNHALGRGPALLFETAIFEKDGSCDVIMRYETPAEARAGHKRCAGLLRFCYGHAPMSPRRLAAKLLTDVLE